MVDWTKELAKAHKVQNSPEGEGWKTMQEIFAESEFGLVKTRKIVNEMIKAGKCERYRGTKYNSVTNSAHICVWYRLIDDKPS